MANTTVATYPGRSIIWNRMKGTGTEALNIGWGNPPTITASASGNVNLFQPQTEARVAGASTIVSTTFLGDTYKVIGTIVCAVGAKTILEAGLFDTTTLSATGTLGASMAIGATSMTLGAPLAPTTGGNFYAQVNNETILVTAGATSIVTVARAQLGSTAVAQPVSSPVTGGGDGGAGGGSTTLQTVAWAAANGGALFIHADFAGVALSINDSIAFTFSDTLT